MNRLYQEYEAGLRTEEEIKELYLSASNALNETLVSGNVRGWKEGETEVNRTFTGSNPEEIRSLAADALYQIDSTKYEALREFTPNFSIAKYVGTIEV